MLKNKIITNSTPIIGLSILGKLHLLADLFEEIYVPKAVFEEIIDSYSSRQYGRDELARMVREGTFQLYDVQNSGLVKKLYGKLHEGELEVIVGAKELDLKFVAIDEHAARTLSKTFLLQPIGTIGILILAKKVGLIEEVKPLLDKLLKHDFYMSKKLYRQALNHAGER
ncbi:MAG TPA: DUF3368 domain-containing protein [Bacillus bacterium]|nr:DUF3368 domain-containing protein [Bacillus sp. (in: firmicutes)]